MKITETITRDCCDVRKDLKTVAGCKMWNYNIPDMKFCIHCGKRWQYTSYMDAVGSTDYEYREVK